MRSYQLIMETWINLDCTYDQYKVYKKLGYQAKRRLIMPKKLDGIGIFNFDKHRNTKEYWDYCKKSKNYTYSVRIKANPRHIAQRLQDSVKNT